jgi:hypothetical protein
MRSPSLRVALSASNRPIMWESTHGRGHRFAVGETRGTIFALTRRPGSNQHGVHVRHPGKRCECSVNLIWIGCKSAQQDDSRCQPFEDKTNALIAASHAGGGAQEMECGNKPSEFAHIWYEGALLQGLLKSAVVCQRRKENLNVRMKIRPNTQFQNLVVNRCGKISLAPFSAQMQQGPLISSSWVAIAATLLALVGAAFFMVAFLRHTITVGPVVCAYGSHASLPQLMRHGECRK